MVHLQGSNLASWQEQAQQQHAAVPYPGSYYHHYSVHYLQGWARDRLNFILSLLSLTFPDLLVVLGRAMGKGLLESTKGKVASGTHGAVVVSGSVLAAADEAPAVDHGGGTCKLSGSLAGRSCKDGHRSLCKFGILQHNGLRDHNGDSSC